MKLNKEKFDELITLTKLYYSTHNIDLVKVLCVKEEELFGEDNYSWMSDIITGITCARNYDNEIYYKVFEVLGYEIH